MARLKGVVKFSGALAELVAYQLNGMWVVGWKSNLDKKRVKTDPVFKNARKASQEFGDVLYILLLVGLIILGLIFESEFTMILIIARALIFLLVWLFFEWFFGLFGF